MDINTYSKAVASAKEIGIDITNATEAETFLALQAGEAVSAAPKSPKAPKAPKAAKPEAPHGVRGKKVVEGTSCAKEILKALSTSETPLTTKEIRATISGAYQPVNVGVSLKKLVDDGSLVRRGEERAYTYRIRASVKKELEASQGEVAAPKAVVAAPPPAAVEAPTASV